MDGENNPITQTEEQHKNNNKKSKNSNPEQVEAGPSTSNNVEKPQNPEQFEYEDVPSKRNYISRKLVTKMRHIIYEYSLRTGEQITGVFIEKPNAPNRDFKIYGTKPLISIMDNLKRSIDQKYLKVLNEEKMPPAKLRCPPLTIDGVVTKLEYFTQAQLRNFIPYLIKYSTGRHFTGWSNPAFKPEWWPQNLDWFNIRFDIRTPEQKKEETWTQTLQRIITSCYKFYGCEEMLHGVECVALPENGQNNSENCVASTSANIHVEKVKTIEPVLIENVPTYQGLQVMNETPTLQITQTSNHLHNNVMYLVQAIGPSTSLLHPIQVLPMKTINLENVNLVNNLGEATQHNEMEVESIDEAFVSANKETTLPPACDDADQDSVQVVQSITFDNLLN